MEQLTKNQAVATSQEAVQNQNEPQLRDENAHNDKSVHGVLNPTYQAGLRRDAVQPDIEAERKKSHLKNIWTAPLPPETELSRQMTTSTTSIDIMGLQAAYANLHTDQERDYFMQRYHDVISSF